ncbi:MAG: BatA domain-containing protein, partial [Bacteroidia bacterium]|nr:BatA domain-containing protein [Bacteroidia bacterium]
ALLLLLLPIIIHLFQLRRFKKTPFTNVKLLQKVVSQSRKSNRLKKWLLLFVRLGLIAAMVLAFAQPFVANESAFVQRDTVIYLDDSFSMQAQNEDGSLFENAIQSVLKGAERDQTVTLFTNTRTFARSYIRDIRGSLLELVPSPHQLSIDEVLLKANTLFENGSGKEKDLILLSDFQERFANQEIDYPDDIRVLAVDLKPEEPSNVTIDSLYVSATNPITLELGVNLSKTGEIEDIPVSLFDDDRLIAKSSANFDGTDQTRVLFSVPEEESINGRVEISDTGLEYDNYLYFNLGDKSRIKVMVIGNSASGYLRRIFTASEFDYTAVGLSDLNYTDIDEQNLIVLNELNNIPLALQNTLGAFSRDGGHIVLIPSNNSSLSEYNNFLAGYGQSRLSTPRTDSLRITSISFQHPLYKQVFEEQVDNFQYPVSSFFYPIENNAGTVLAYSDNSPFLSGRPGFYIFSSPLSTSDCNFINSPLVVPTFYEMGKQSLALPDLYYSLGDRSEVDINIPMAQDQIIKVAREGYEFIPLQQSFAKKTRLTFIDNPVLHGTYSVLVKGDTLKQISFNYPREESKLTYSDPSNISELSMKENIEELFTDLAEENRVESLWKWFIILALIFILSEVGIQKFIR